MAADDASLQLREQGIVLLKGAFARDSLAGLKDATVRCFQKINSGDALPEHYRFSQSSHSVLLTSLLDFGCNNAEELAAPLSAPGIGELISQAMGCEWTCNMEQSWVRKKFAPLLAPASGYHLQNWHQDGALGVRFPREAGPVIPVTKLLTCWIPMNPCGVDSPGLEFIRRRQPELLHFTELDDWTLRVRFSPQEFWAPALDFGDGLVFMNDILHRTFTLPEMTHNRLSVEYRIFPR